MSATAEHSGVPSGRSDAGDPRLLHFSGLSQFEHVRELVGEPGRGSTFTVMLPPQAPATPPAP
jgi:hypothetical protein